MKFSSLFKVPGNGHFPILHFLVRPATDALRFVIQRQHLHSLNVGETFGNVIGDEVDAEEIRLKSKANEIKSDLKLDLDVEAAPKNAANRIIKPNCGIQRFICCQSQSLKSEAFLQSIFHQ